MYGVPGPWFAMMLIVLTALGFSAFMIVSSRRFDARARRRREEAGASNPAE